MLTASPTCGGGGGGTLRTIRFMSNPKAHPHPVTIRERRLYASTARLLNYSSPLTTLPVSEPVSIDVLVPKNAETSASTVGDGLTLEELEILRTRLSKQQEQFHEHRIKEFTRKLSKIRTMYEYLTAEEVHEALEHFNGNEDQVLVELTNPEVLIMIRKAVALKYVAVNSDKAARLSEKEKSAQKQLSERRIQSAGRGFISVHRRKVYKTEGRLRLDDAVAQLRTTADLEKAMEGWSSARVRAYKALKDKPNTYYYRFNAPGEQQRNGPWTIAEHEQFMKRIREVGADGQWGVFSMAIPGRVGYQCANYYRKLIEAGRVQDGNYVVDPKGKAHYVFGTKSREALANGDYSPSTTKRQNNNASTATKRRIKEDPSSSEEYESVSEESSSTIELGSSSSNDDFDNGEEDFTPRIKAPAPFHPNPLPGFIDVITRQEVERPAISPYGHVLSYDTWLRCICTGERKNTCPFTKQPLHKRQLVLLTEENVAIYREIIKRDF